MAPKLLTGIGCVLFGLSLLALAICIALPIVNGPRTSWDEAMAGSRAPSVPAARCFRSGAVRRGSRCREARAGTRRPP